MNNGSTRGARTWLKNCLALASVVGAASAQALADDQTLVPCGSPAAGSCFMQHEPGCNDASCCNAVCANDPFCCNVTWDAVCISGAIALCPMQEFTGGVINPWTGHRHRLLTPHAWPVSLAFAESLGESLATINNGVENTWLLQNLANNVDGVSRSPWIGLTDEGNEGAFHWSSNQPLTFINWSLGEPNDAVGGEDFVHMYGSTGRWNDLGPVAEWGLTERQEPACGPSAGSCFSTHGPGCDMESCCNVVCAEDPFCCTNNWDSQCVSEADKWCAPEIVAGPIFNPATGHKYYLLGLTSWSEAEKKALQLYGHLATIENNAENQWLKLNLQSFGGVDRHPFIGMHDQAIEGSFQWTSHMPTTYFNWAPGEPNNAFNEDHVHMRPDGMWNDGHNTSSINHAIIEVPCAGDLDSDGSVGGSDLGILLGAWAATASPADINQDGIVDAVDLGIVLGAWGSCGSTNCCSPWGGIGCDQPGCTDCVCYGDPFCCEVAWDAICVERASGLCAEACSCVTN